MRAVHLLLVPLVVALAACGPQGPADPRPSSPATSPAPDDGARSPVAAVRGVVLALDDGDCRTVRRLVVTPDAVDCADVEASRGSLADEGTDRDAIRYRQVSRRGDDARVRVDWTPGRPSMPGETFDVQRADGSWRVVLDSAA